MSYSITAILHPHVDKNNLHKIQIRVIYNRTKVYIKTDFKVKSDQFAAGLVQGHPQALKINSILRKQITDAESILIERLRSPLTGEDFKTLFKKQEIASANVYEYMIGLIERLNGKRSAAYCRQLRVAADKVDPYLNFSAVNSAWLESIETQMRKDKLDGNTINSQMKRLKSMLVHAAGEGFFELPVISKYKIPPYKQKLVDYLTEAEIKAFSDLLKKVNQPAHRIAGYYFLLSCYTGWRIADVKTFSENRISGDKLILRAKKNGKIVSIPLHSRLKEVLKFTRAQPFTLSESNARKYVKELAVMAGITKRVKFHTGRHSFAMLLMSNGFTIDEVAELIGDSPLIAKVYARVDNEVLNKKIRERLK